MATKNLSLQNFYVDSLKTDISASSTTIYLNSAPSVQEGYLVISPDDPVRKEIIYFTSMNTQAGTVTCPDVANGRGVGGTTAQSHTAGETVKNNVVAEYIKELQNGNALQAERKVDGKTVIGANDYRAVRYVPLIPAIEIVNKDPNSVTWGDEVVDVTAQTSPNTYAIAIMSNITSSATVASLYARAKGDATAGFIALTAVNRGIASAVSWSHSIIPVNADQQFEWNVNRVDATNVTFVIRGYWEYVDGN